MKKFLTISLAAFVVVALTAGVAVAERALTVSAPASVTYLKPFKVRVATGESAAESFTVQWRYPGDEWKKLRTFSASRAAEATTFSTPAPKISKLAEFRAISATLESAVVTVGVKARMSDPVLPHRVKAGKAVRITGHVWPGHALDTPVVALKIYSWSKSAKEWELSTEITGTVVSRTTLKIDGAKTSACKWGATWTPSAKGRYKIVAVHEDAEHLATSTEERVEVR
jgi:hypothetical protein